MGRLQDFFQMVKEKILRFYLEEPNSGFCCSGLRWRPESSVGRSGSGKSGGVRVIYYNTELLIRFAKFQCPAIGVACDCLASNFISQFIVRTVMQTGIIDELKASGFYFLDRRGRRR